eukprot:219478_1
MSTSALFRRFLCVFLVSVIMYCTCIFLSMCQLQFNSQSVTYIPVYSENDSQYLYHVYLKNTTQIITVKINETKVLFTKYKIHLLNIIIDDRNSTHPKFKLFGLMPYQLLPPSFWTTTLFAFRYCQRLNKCIINFNLEIKELILQKTDNNNNNYLQIHNLNKECSLISLNQNAFRLTTDRGPFPYAMIVIECNVNHSQNINQKQYKITYFHLEITYNVNNSYPQFSNKDIYKGFSTNFLNNNNSNYSAKQHIYYIYNSLIDQNIEIRWDKTIKPDKIGICTTASFGFPVFISLWLNHIIFDLDDIIDKIIIYINYKSITPEYQTFLNLDAIKKTSKIELVNWTLSNKLDDPQSGYYEYQQMAYTNCLFNNMYKYKWLIYLDTDDSLNILNNNNNKFLNYLQITERNRSLNGIEFPWISWNYA